MAESITEKGEVQELRENADNLRAWMDSLLANQKEAAWMSGYGIERAAKDALDCSFRLAASVVAALEQTAKALERLERERDANIV